MKLLILCNRSTGYKTKKMHRKLKNLARITAGFYERTNRQGTIFYIQRRDFDEDKNLITKGLKPSILANANVQKHLLQMNDVLVAAKGTNYFAFVYKGQVQPAVASSVFLVLRDIDQEQILSDYLAWFINYSKTQDFLRSMSKGTALAAINKSTLGALSIPMLSLEKQRLMTSLQALQQKEQAIYSQLSELSALIINQKLNKLLKEQ